MEKMRFAVVGIGGFGNRHASAIRCSHDMELVCICDVRQSLAMNKADIYDCTYYTDYREMLRDGGFDCVVVATNDQTHAEISVAAMEAGYHVLCEKPLALTREDCLAVVDAVRRTGRCFAVGQSMRKSNCVRMAKELLREGRLGKIFRVETEYSHNYSRLKPEWRRDPVQLRYPMIGGGCHAIDSLRYLMGEDPTEVIAISNHMVLKDWPVDDCTVALLKMPGGAVGQLTCSIGIQKQYSMYLNFYGTNGTLEANTKGEALFLHTPAEDYEESNLFDVTEIPLDNAENHNVEEELAELCRAIRYGEPISCDALEGAKTVAVGLAAVESARLGGIPVKPNYDF